MTLIEKIRQISPTERMELKRKITRGVASILTVGVFAYGTLVLPNANKETVAPIKKATPLQILSCASPTYTGLVAPNATGSDDWFRYEQLSNTTNKNPNSQSLIYNGNTISLEERTSLARDLNNNRLATPGEEYTVVNLDGIKGPDGKPTLGYLLIPDSIRQVPNPLLNEKTKECKYTGEK